MNRFAAGGLAVALGLAAGMAAADGPKPARTSGKKPDEKVEKKADTPLRPPVIIAPLTADVLSEAVKDEQAACTRRLDACAKLREIAAAKNDEKSLAQIDELEKQAIEICQARVARMGVRGTAARSSVVRAAAEPPFDPAAVAPPAPVETPGGKR
jgi:hypothetical protein